MKKTIALTLAIILCVTILVGCGGAGGGASLSGKYVITSMVVNGQDMLESLTALGVSTDIIYMEFLDGEKFSLVMEAAGAGNQEGTYKVDGNTLTLTVDGVDVQATLDGNTITMEQDGSTMTFEKK